MTNLLTYLLIGFVIHWVGAQVFKAPPNPSWLWELTATVLWPLTLLAVIGNHFLKRSKAL